MPPEREAGSTHDASTDASSEAADGGGVLPAVVVHEVYVDRILAGDQTEWIELRSAPGTPVAALRLRVVHANGSVDVFTVGDATDVFPASGLWVVGGGNLPGGVTANKVHGVGAGWGLGGRGAVQLLRQPNDQLLDVVGWTDTMPPPAIPAIPAPAAIAEGNPVLLPAAGGKSIGRRATGADTNDNTADFCAMSTSAKAAQLACDP